MQVVHIIRDLDAASGGPSRSLPALVRGQSRVFNQSQLKVLFQDRGQQMTVDPAEELPSKFMPVAAGSALGPLRIRKLLERIHREDKIDLLHLHGIWSPTIHVAARFARRQKIPYVISPRGMLSAWCLNNKSMRKRAAWQFYQYSDLQQAACLHATSDDEAADIRASGLRPPIAMIPHGCELPLGQHASEPSNTHLAVCLTRIHPVKGLGDLVAAWAAIRPGDWQLVIAGPDTNGYGAKLRQEISQQQLDDSVSLIDAVDGAEKWDWLSRAELFISASHSENFGMSIAESLAAGTPVITTQATPWQSILDHRCGWWVPVGCEGLGAAISEAISLGSEKLAKMGQRGSQLIRSEYSWDAIANRTWRMYRWLDDTSQQVPPDVTT